MESYQLAAGFHLARKGGLPVSPPEHLVDGPFDAIDQSSASAGIPLGVEESSDLKIWGVSFQLN